MDAAEFTERFLFREIQILQQSGVQLQLLSAISQCMETAGALLDDKPFKAKGQGKKRFKLCVRKLFPQAYQEACLQFDLYNLLRSHMAHCMLPATQIQVHSITENHLRSENGALTISIEQLYLDHCAAMEQLLTLIRSGKLKNKKIVFDNLNLK